MPSGLTLIATGMAAMLLMCASDDRSPTGLQQRLEKLVSHYPNATIAVAVRDPSSGLSVDVNSDTLIHAASTMKIPVLIEIYRQAEARRFSLDDSLEIRNEFTSIFDGSPFSVGVEDDSDKEIYGAIGGKMTIRDLAYRLITSSSNLATNLLIDLVSADSVQRTIEDLGTTRMRVLRGVEDLKAFDAGMNNLATASDLALLLEALLDGRAVSESASREMIDILLDVPSFRMVNEGVPPGIGVAHKTGHISTRNHRHDAAIVFPPSGEPYILVILTRDTASTEAAEEAGKSISEAVYADLRG